ncbi:MAG: hypothetical protein RBR67_07160 [Desulfobacterium sp.]|nr:hypothetical protein [Desulfobacterium sp.]
MSNGISMFNPRVGINGISTPQTENISIARQKGGMSPALSITGNEQGLETYNGKNLDSIVDAYLQPKSQDPDLMSPQVFEHTVASALDKLVSLGDNPDLKALNANIAENTSMINMFASLVVQG